MKKKFYKSNIIYVLILKMKDFKINKGSIHAYNGLINLIKILIKSFQFYL